MGDEAGNTLHSFGLTAEESTSYEVVLARLQSHCTNTREPCSTVGDRGKGSLWTLVMAIYWWMEHCGCGDLHDQKT